LRDWESVMLEQLLNSYCILLYIAVPVSDNEWLLFACKLGNIRRNVGRATKYAKPKDRNLSIIFLNVPVCTFTIYIDKYVIIVIVINISDLENRN
jgi:hypothetical protein